MKESIHKYFKVGTIQWMSFPNSAPLDSLLAIARDDYFDAVELTGYGADRDEIFAALKEYNIFARKYFYPCINDYACYREQFSSDDTPVAKRIASEVLTLPLYPDLSLETVDEICDIILKCGEKSK